MSPCKNTRAHAHRAETWNSYDYIMNEYKRVQVCCHACARTRESLRNTHISLCVCCERSRARASLSKTYTEAPKWLCQFQLVAIVARIAQTDTLRAIESHKYARARPNPVTRLSTCVHNCVQIFDIRSREFLSFPRSFCLLVVRVFMCTFVGDLYRTCHTPHTPRCATHPIQSAPATCHRLAHARSPKGL